MWTLAKVFGNVIIPRPYLAWNPNTPCGYIDSVLQMAIIRGGKIELEN